MRQKKVIFVAAALAIALMSQVSLAAADVSSKAKLVARIEAMKQELWDMAEWMYKNPEPGHKEQGAVKLLTDYLKKNGWNVEIGLNKVDPYWEPILKQAWNMTSLPTAFKATYPGLSGGPTIGIIVEYDALRGPGGVAFHGCQHNLQGPAGIAAAIAVAEELKARRLPGQIVVFGTPAEEIPPPVKAILYDSGYFKGVDAMIMFHGSTTTTRKRTGPSGMALDSLEFVFHGKPAHAAADPWNGKSALDAVILMFNGIDALREHSDPGTRMHGVITDGGAAPNVVPERAATVWMIRHFERKYVDEQVKKVIDIAKGAALMTGTTVEVHPQGKYDNSININALEERAFEYAKAYGGTNVVEPDPCPPKTGASTDFGTVSYNIPSISISVQSAPEGTASHSQENADATVAEIGRKGMLIASKVEASLAWDLLTDPAFLAQVKKEHAALK